ncbi:MAG: sulfatase [Planctomycetes bacterium]|nr:sulfatase [Planctomycetota bacterium]
MLRSLAYSLVAFVAVLGSLPPVSLAADAPPSSKPNVIVILADDLGWSDTTLYGTTRFYQTPNVERLARRGMTFTRAYSASPLCSPTRSALLTGLSPARTGITAPNCHLPQVVLEAKVAASGPPDQKAVMPQPVTRLKTEYRTLAESLKDAGYATAHFGKWHLGSEPYSPLQQGFDADVPHWSGPGPAGSYVAPWKFKDFHHDPAVPDQHIEDRMAQEAAAFIEQHKDRPFFLNYWMFSVHAPFDAKQSLISKHRGRVDSTDSQRCPTYAAMVESMDEAVGTLLDTLDRLKLSDNTIVIFTSDNGGNMYNEVEGEVPTSNAPLRGGKATMFEGGTRVPCVVVAPGIASPGSRSDALIQSEDFCPTLLEILGLRPLADQKFDGASILPALHGEPLDGKAIFQYFPHNPGVPDWLPPAVSVHRDDWKLIRIFHGGEQKAHRYLLFNLRDDLGEKKNLASAEPELAGELDALISKFLAGTNAVVPLPNSAFDPARYRPEDEGKAKKSTKPNAPATKAGQADYSDPSLQGWKIRNGRAVVRSGIVTVSGPGESFLGVGTGTAGPAKVGIRIRSKSGGTGKAEWIPSGSRGQSVPFNIPAGEWQDVMVEIPADGPLGILRLYLPTQSAPVEIDHIELKGSDKSRRWDF